MSESSSNSSGVERNSSLLPRDITEVKKKKKQISPSINWCFTLNNWTEIQYSSIVLLLEEHCNKYVVGKEVGEEGTPHLQGFLQFKTKKRPKGLFNIPAIHWKKMYKDSTPLYNYEYCNKDGDFISKGFPRPLKLISKKDLFWWQKDILERIKVEPDNRTIHWYWSQKGKMGKTQFCKYLSHEHNAACLHGKGADVRNGIIEYSESNEGILPELVVFPIVRSYNTDYLCYESLENIKDMYFYSGKYHGGMVNGNSPHLFVFSNEPPDKSKLSEDRWHIVEIKQNTVCPLI